MTESYQPAIDFLRSLARSEPNEFLELHRNRCNVLLSILSDVRTSFNSNLGSCFTRVKQLETKLKQRENEEYTDDLKLGAIRRELLALHGGLVELKVDALEYLLDMDHFRLLVWENSGFKRLSDKDLVHYAKELGINAVSNVPLLGYFVSILQGINTVREWTRQEQEVQAELKVIATILELFEFLNQLEFKGVPNIRKIIASRQRSIDAIHKLLDAIEHRLSSESSDDPEQLRENVTPTIAYRN